MIMPHDHQLEQSLLAACILSPEFIDDLSGLLLPTDFYSTANQKIYSTMLHMSRTKVNIDLPMLAMFLKESGDLNVCGGTTYIASILDIPLSISPKTTAQKIIEYSRIRQVMQITSKYYGMSQESGVDVESLIDGIQSEIMQIGSSSSGFVRMSDFLEPALDRYEYLKQNVGRLTGVSTGLIDLDYLTQGWQNSDLIIIAARPSMGKTALAVNSILAGAAKNHKAGIFSLEMAGSQLVNRVMAIKSKVNSTKFRTGRFEDDDWEVLTRAASDIYSYPVWIDDAANQNIQQIIRKIKKLKKQEDIDIVWLDYLGFIKGEALEKRYLEVGSISRGLKGVAKELDIPIILLCQLNRQCETRDNKRPRLSDLRESGDIEQDADLVCFLYRHEHYLKPAINSAEYNEWHGIAELEVAKHRNGPTGAIKMFWDDKTTTFSNYSGVQDGY